MRKNMLNIIIIILVVIINICLLNSIKYQYKIQNDNSFLAYDDSTLLKQQEMYNYIRTSTTTTTTTTTTSSVTVLIDTPENKAQKIGIITFEAGVPVTLEDRVIENYTKLPENVKRQLIDNGWQIKVLGSSLSQRVGYSYSILALIRYGEKTIYLDHRDEAAKALFHEIGHFVSYINGRVHNNEEFINIHAEEKNMFVSYTGSIEANVGTTVEYFAEAYEQYLTNPDVLKNNCPKTYEYLDYYTNIIK